MTSHHPPHRARPFVICLPVGLLSAAGAATVPAVLALALSFGASPAAAGLVTTMAAAGQVLASVPAGHVAGRIGVRLALPLSAALILVGLIVLLLAPNTLLLAAGVFVVGVGSSAHTICRLAAVSAEIPRAGRPEAFAHLSIAIRLGAVAGPLGGALAFLATRDVRAPVAFAVTLGATALTIHLLARLPVVETVSGAANDSLRATVVQSRAVLGRVSGISLAVAGLRHMKIILIPLVALSIGLDLGQVSLLLAVTATIGVGAMYAGARIGRAHGWFATGLASNVGIAAGLIILVFAGSPPALIGAVLIIEVANGIGAGFMSTLFAESAPENNPAPLMGVFNMVAETVSVAAPAALMGVVAVSALPVGVAVGAAFGVAGSLWLWRWGRVPTHQPAAAHIPLYEQ